MAAHDKKLTVPVKERLGGVRKDTVKMTQAFDAGIGVAKSQNDIQKKGGLTKRAADIAPLRSTTRLNPAVCLFRKR